MGDAAAVKAIQSNLLEAMTSVDHGGLVCAACNGVWICPRYKDMLYVCRGNIVGEYLLFGITLWEAFYRFFKNQQNR